jgi:hypothetical protein
VVTELIPPVGSPITVVVQQAFAAEPVFRRGFCLGAVTNPSAGFAVGSPAYVGQVSSMVYSIVSCDGEGKTWIRGHHDENSSEGRALLAAFVLTR